MNNLKTTKIKLDRRTNYHGNPSITSEGQLIHRYQHNTVLFVRKHEELQKYFLLAHRSYAFICKPWAQIRYNDTLWGIISAIEYYCGDTE